MLENIYEFIPEPPLSRILMKKLQGKRKLRVKKSKVMEKKLGAEKEALQKRLDSAISELKRVVRERITIGKTNVRINF